MITLLEPVRPAGFVSGGYRYQDEVMRRLAARGRGRQLAIEPGQLRATIAKLRRDGAEPIVADGLFITKTGAPLPADVIALLHMTPRLSPWSEVPLHVIATGRPTAANVRGHARSVRLVRPGIDACFTPPADPPTNANKRIVCVGTVCGAKGQTLIANTIASAASSEPPELRLIGDTNADPNYVTELRTAARCITLTLLGCLPPEAVANELQQADLFVSASRDESFGMAVAEATACGVPVVAFDTGEIATLCPTSIRIPSNAADDVFARRLLVAIRDLATARQATGATPSPVLSSWDAVANEFERACTAR